MKAMLSKLTISSGSVELIEKLCLIYFENGWRLEKCWYEKTGFWIFGTTEYFVSILPPELSKEEQLEMAVMEERFEDAARLRDELKLSK